MRIYGITYADKKTEFIEYRNEFTEKLWRFENNPMIDIVDNHLAGVNDNEYVGVFSWKFTIKTGLTKSDILRRIQGKGKPDVFSFCARIPTSGNFMDWSDEGHKGIKEFINRCCDHVGLVYNNDPEHIFYANQFIAKKIIYIDYINSVIKPCLELLEGPMWEEVNKDPGYTRAVAGVYYNYITFILERMFMQYVDNKKLSVVTILK